MDESNKGIIMKDYQEDYENYWKDIIEDENGEINKDALMRELFDYSVVMDEVPKVYLELTGGKISKPNTRSEAVIEAIENHFDGLADSVLLY